MRAARALFLLSLAASLVACNSGDDGPKPSYAATRLTAIESAGMSATALNDNGDIAGVLNAEAAVYSNGSIKSLGTLPGYTASGGVSINNLGQVVGYLYSPLKQHPFLYTAGGMTELSGLTTANGINNRGEVIGSLVTPPPPEQRTRTFMYSGGAYVDVAPSVDQSDPNSVNDSGEIVGSFYPPGELRHPFVYSNGKFTGLDFRGVAYDINSKGEVVGTTIDDVSNPTVSRAFVYSAGKVTFIENPDGCCIFAGSIDTTGRIYGFRRVKPQDTPTAFVRSEGKIYDLTPLVVSGMPSDEAVVGIADVNGRGQLLVSGCQNPCKTGHLYVLDPL